ncbi:dihydropyrimidinase [Lentimicrobium sp. L6]|uniref:dihydropyrimidinase n=1 Tax=Lentimicrobium sp. L6 TaxID=2735916 RepID=UPI001556229B|nr:dihydropyrimidinase [Lentimicrobium sp. L6]NPD84584.1 dihydropyrimidinase [Lentimicrobium sp. L6]
MEILIKNANIINADSTNSADILCKNGKILEIGKELKVQSKKAKIIDAEGKYVFPGGIDPHVHMHLPTPAGFSADDFESGSKAAFKGGTTTIIDFVTPQKGQSLQDAIKERQEEARNSLIDCYFHVSPIEWRDSMEQEIAQCIKDGYKSFKVYMAYKDSIGLDDDVLLKVMKAVAKHGGMVTLHCEMGDKIEEARNRLYAENKRSPKYHAISRPAKWEAQAVKRAIELATQADCPIYIVHVSAKESLVYIAAAQDKGQQVIAETCPQYLLYDDSIYEEDFETAANFIMSPPPRKKEDQEALWAAIKSGVVSTIGTDHCPFTKEQKALGKDDFRKIPNGTRGVEQRLNLIYKHGVLENRITLQEYVAITSTNAAKTFGLFPQKGQIAIGSDADIRVVNPQSGSTTLTLKANPLGTRI